MQASQDPSIDTFVHNHLVFAATTLASAFIVGCASGRLWFDRAIAAQKVLAETHELSAKQAKEVLANYRTVNESTSDEDKAKLRTLENALARKRLGRFFSVLALSAIFASVSYAIYLQNIIEESVKTRFGQESIFEQQTRSTLADIQAQLARKLGAPKPLPPKAKTGKPAQ